MNHGEKIAAWYEKTSADSKLLFDVEFVSKVVDGGFTLTPSYIATHGIGGCQETLAKYTRLIIIDLEDKGILQFGELSSTACNWRIKLFKWYSVLSAGQKQILPLNGNKISARYVSRNVPQLEGIESPSRYLKGVKDAFETINAEHLDAGYADPEYKTTKERNAPTPKTEYLTEPLRVLSSQPLHSVSDLAVGTKHLPFAPLLHLLAQVSLRGKNSKKLGVYWAVYDHLKKMLVQQGFTGDETYEHLLDPMLLANYRKYLSEFVNSRVFSPGYATDLLSRLRGSLKIARTVKGLDKFKFFGVPGFSKERVTDYYRPYSPSDRTLISETVGADIAKYNSLTAPYVLSGVGCDPKRADGKFSWVGNVIDNARWVFENKLGCEHRIRHDNIQSDYENFFVKALSLESENGTRAVLESWGIIWKIDTSVIAPYMVRLAQVTGLNANSLKCLRVGDYTDRHPLTHRPCLRYWKERSDGEKEYHLDIFNAEITWLTYAQSVEVKKIFDAVLLLTADVRSRAPDELKSHLFIWDSVGRRNFGVIKSLESSRVDVVTDLFADYSKAKGLVSEDGSSLSITPSRLRPSFISELVEKGVPLREVQYILGHKYITTTIDYLDQLDYNRIARGKLTAEIGALHQRTLTKAEHKVGADGTSSVPAPPDAGGSNIIFKTPLASCRNIFNPPEHVRKSAYYVPGKPCSIYNKCLGCDNSMITALNLPDIFALKRDYLKAIEVTRVMDTPYGMAIAENLALIEGIVGPDSDFSQVELAKAEAESEFICSTIIVDGVAL
ncbi:tyrosine-type recombinase/integrase [Pseudomonas sp. P1.8]|uniref:tyrosine-type recombinase/integrase n=1 Tax=Pseudomonas sp. P1.8 TaxID=1699310 RepID=UPI00069E8778|nr:tyrosine-type recombinase/integrase [Pseudomonas sp. P1.8]